jgi:hypothetical protein
MAVPKTPEEAVAARLKADKAVQAIQQDRVYPQLATQEPTYPCSTYQRTGLDKPQRLDGASQVTKYLVEVALFARTEAELHALGVATVNALQNWRDPANNVQGCFHTDSDASADEEGQVRTIRHTFAVWFKS